MTENRDWTGKVGASWAAQWRRTDRCFRGLTPRLIEAARAKPFSSALDIGCGAGEIVCALAQQAPQVHVTGLDISAELLDIARSRCDGLDNAAFAHADAAVFQTREAPDLLVSRHGVMFFGDPVGAFAHLRAIAAPGAHLVFSCFRSRGQNDWATVPMAVLDDPPPLPTDPFAPGPFAFAERDHVASVLTEAGWEDPAFEALDYRMILSEGEHPVSDAIDYLLHIGPLAPAMADLPAGERQAALDRLGDVLEDNRDGDTVSMRAATWIVMARKQ